MLLSMTGFGRAVVAHKDKTITIEIRSLNSKTTDIRFKIPNNYREKEIDFRRILSERCERGKIDMAISTKSLQADEDFALNVPLFKRYYQELSKIAQELGANSNDLMAAVLRIQGVVGNEDGALDDDEWDCIQKGMSLALDDFTAFRVEEGKAMKMALNEHVQSIMQCISDISPFEHDRIQKLRNRLGQNLEEFLGKTNVDENRFEQEVIFYIEKIDISEEKTRLEQHCKYFLEQLNAKDTVKGRTLNFISQEMGREINTLGAKAYHSEIQKLVVRMKDELEKIKEQLANVV